MCSVMAESCIQTLGLMVIYNITFEIDHIPINRTTPITVKALIIHKITSNLPFSYIETLFWNVLKSISFANSTDNQTKQN